MNAVLVQNGYPPAIIPPILRGDYIRALEKAWTSEQFFIEFISGRVLEAEKDLMRMLHIPFPDNRGKDAALEKSNQGERVM
jgi:hypothetical protein